MQIDFSQIKRDAFGRIEPPIFLLQKPNEETIGVLADVIEPRGEFKFTELSTLSFSYPRKNGKTTLPLFDELKMGRLIRIEPYGVFVIADTQETELELRKTVEVTAYSREYEIARKRIVFAAGTYRFYSPVDSEVTIMSMVKEKLRGWKIGEVPSSLWDTYRTFSDTDKGLLEFLQTDVQKSYNCVILFDTFEKIINVVDANADAVMLPIYLSSKNLIKERTINTSESNMATKVSVYGADGVSIRNVNPTGSNEIINLGYALSTGDLSGALADKYKEWKTEIINQQKTYTSLIALRNSAYSRYLTEKAVLTDMNSKLASIDDQRAVYIQAKSIAENADTLKDAEEKLAELNEEYTKQQEAIAKQNELLDSINDDYEAFGVKIAEIVSTLKMENYFSNDELDALEPFLIEGEISDSTFAVYDVDISSHPDVFRDGSVAAVAFTGVTAEYMSDDSSEHSIAVVAGGKFAVTMIVGEEVHVETVSNVIHGIIDADNDGSIVISVRANINEGVGDIDSPRSSNLTFVGKGNFDFSGMEQTETNFTDSETGVTFTKVTYQGDPTIDVTEGKICYTSNSTEYQQYSVEQELYDYATQKIEELAYPVSEFEIDMANPIYAKQFEVFKNELALGKGVYLRLNENLVLKPIVLEIHMSFHQPDDFKMIFSNQFQLKRPDSVNRMKQILEDAVSTSRTLELGKNMFGEYQNSGAKDAVTSFLQTGLNTAYTTVTSGNGNTVMNQAGLVSRSPDRPHCVMLANGMLAIVDEKKQEAKGAVGYFYNEASDAEDESGKYFTGVIADVIGGKMVVGNQLLMECSTLDGNGITQFKFDKTGAFLNNSRLYLQSTGGGKIGLDPKYGLIVGNDAENPLFEMKDTGNITPVFIGEDGKPVFDNNGFPLYTNVWIGMDGEVYIRGNIYAESGIFTGVVKATDYQDKDGNTLLCSDAKGNPIYKFQSQYLDLGNITLDGVTGDITMSGNLNLSSVSSITWSDGNNPASYDNVKGLWASEAKPALTFIDGDQVDTVTIHAENIYGGHMYAGEDDLSFAAMSGDGFYLYHTDVDNPKAMITMTDPGNLVQMVLGAGSSSQSDYAGRLFIQKGSAGGVNKAGIYYYTSETKMVGFTFNDDGSISIHGDMAGANTAVFG